MKGSPVIATLAVIIILLGLYTVTRTVLLGEIDKTQKEHVGHGHDHHGHDHHGHGHGHDHHGHDHGTHEEHHDDSSVETQFEVFFSSVPKSLTITHPVTKREIIRATEFDSVEWLGKASISLEGHEVELLVDVEWENPGEMNFAQIFLSPAKHATRTATLRSEDSISEIASFSW